MSDCEEPRDVTLRVNENGRCTVPEGDRIALGIDGENALLDAKVTVIDTGLDPKRRTDGGSRAGVNDE